MKKQSSSHKHDWIITLLFGILALLPITGIVSVWESALHTPYIILSIITPLALIALGFIAIAIRGSRKFVKDVIRIIFEPIYWIG